MLFKPELIDLIQQGAKTQTRRVVKDREELTGFMPGTRFSYCVAKLADNKPQRIKWQVGRTYAICPGRGKKGVGRICINRLRCEGDVRSISLSDALAEGFDSQNAFLETWFSINDRFAQAWWDKEHDCWHWYSKGWKRQDNGDDWDAHLMSRPADRYRAWVIEFEKV